MLYLLFILIISGVWSEKLEHIVASVGRPFSFDCKQDDSVYFARQLNDWSEIQENNNKLAYLNLNFNYLDKNILRLTSNSAQSENIGYYGCRKATWATTEMNRIYQVTLPDVQSFYWTYICYGPAGSCVRSDDPSDENLSTFEVADQTNVELLCCASATGFKNVNINMNQVGVIRGKINVHRKKQESDGSWVVCANQQTFFKRSSLINTPKFTCELTTDDQVYLSQSSIIVMKDAMEADPDIDPPYGYTPPSTKDDDNYFKKTSSARRRKKLTPGKRISIILGSILGALLLLGILFLVIVCLRRKRKASTNLNTNRSNEYSSVNQKSNKENPTEEEEEEHIYIEPTPLYQNTPISLRL